MCQVYVQFVLVVVTSINITEDKINNAMITQCIFIDFVDVED